MAGGKNPNPKKEESKKEEQKDNFSLEFINTSSLGGVRKVFNNAPNGKFKFLCLSLFMWPTKYCKKWHLNNFRWSAQSYKS